MEKTKEVESDMTNTNNSKTNWCRNNLLNWKDPKDRAKILLQLAQIILSGVIFGLSFIISYDGEISKSISDELIDNFETGYFMSFNNENAGEKVKFGIWQGTVKGCGIIKDGKKQAIILEEGQKCEDGEEIEEIPSQDILVYKGLSLSSSTKGRYIDLLNDGSIVKKDKKCPNTKKNCGYIDTLKNILCLDNEVPCPISYVKIQENEPTGIENINTIKGTNINFYYSNSPYSNSYDIPYILNSFKIADSIMCALPNLYYSEIFLYYLDGFRKKYSQNCVLKDYSQKVTADKIRYHAIDEVDNYDLYEENKIIDKIKNSKLMEYGFDIDKYKGNKLTLYVRTHFGFDIDCLKTMGFSEEHLVYIYGRADNMIIYGNMAFCLLGIISFSSFNIFSFTGACSLNDLKSLETLIKYFTNFGISLYLLVYSFFAVQFDDNYEKEMTCSDIVTNNNYNIMIYKVNRSGKIILVTSILYFVLFIIIVFSGIYILTLRTIKKCCCCCKKKKEREAQAVQTVVEMSTSPIIKDENKKESDDKIENENEDDNKE